MSISQQANFGCSNEIIVNGKKFKLPGSYSNMSIIDGKVIIDGKELEGIGDSKKYEITIQGNVGSLEVKEGSVTVNGNVEGNVKAGGVVECKDVKGSVEGGNIITVNGSVGGDVKAGNMVNCGDVQGKVTAGNMVVRN